jgi:hypothetical protein
MTSEKWQDNTYVKIITIFWEAVDISYMLIITSFWFVHFLLTLYIYSFLSHFDYRLMTIKGRKDIENISFAENAEKLKPVFYFIVLCC